jgi:anaerobic selenocysteine-containing dehydrogenase
MVSVDIYVNETTRHADVILPGWSPLEDEHYDVAFPQLSHRNHARYSGAVFLPPAGHPPEWQTLLRLAAIARGQGAGVDVLALDDELLADDLRKQAGDNAALVLQALAGRRGPDRLLDLALRSGPHGDGFGRKPDGLTLDKVMAAPGGIDLGALTSRVPEILRTLSGKIELAPPLLLADLPRALADLDTPAPPLVVIGRRDVRTNNSWMHNLPTLAKGPFRCTALVHPEDAARCGVADGGSARLAGNGRELMVTVEISAAMRPGVISLPHGWGHDLPGARLALAAERPGVNLNELLDASLRDPLSGNAVLSGGAVTLAAA